MTNTHQATTSHHPDTGRPLTMLLSPGETLAAAIAAELLNAAHDADANAARYDTHRNDHGGIGSASRAYRTVATSLRWRAQILLDKAANTTGHQRPSGNATHPYTGPTNAPLAHPMDTDPFAGIPNADDSDNQPWGA
jgi:hypothetical protein